MHEQTALDIDAADARPGPEGSAGPVLLVRCRFCHRPLTDRTSRMWRIGPRCRHDQRTAPELPAHHMDQDTLPGT